MEAEERPAKIRRLSPSIEQSTATERTAPVDSQHDTNLEPKRRLTNDHDQLATATGGEDISEGTSERPPEAKQSEDVLSVIKTLGQDSNLESQPQLSKNALKKIRRQQEWEAGRGYRREKRKEKNKERKERKRVAKQEQEAAGDPTASQVQARRRPVQLPVTFILDCGFDELMLDKEIISLASQLTRCYSDNSRSSFRAHIAVSSFDGKLRDRFDKVLDAQHKKWRGVKVYTEDFVQVSQMAEETMKGKKGGELQGAFSGASDTQGEVVYLTADCDETLEELKPYSTYIIGGLVDRNRHKGVCYKRAVQRNIRTAKLPIGDYLEMSSRPVLATNHVNEIMLKWLELGDWAKAFVQVMPKRKGGVLKNADSGNDDTAGIEEDDIDEDVVEGVEGVEDVEDVVEDVKADLTGQTGQDYAADSTDNQLRQEEGAGHTDHQEQEEAANSTCLLSQEQTAATNSSSGQEAAVSTLQKSQEEPTDTTG